MGGYCTNRLRRSPSTARPDSLSATWKQSTDVITFEGETVKELKQAFQDSVDDYLDFCKQRGEEPEKPYSGKFVVRVEPELHKNITIEARKKGKSLNVWVKDALSKALNDLTQQEHSH